MKQILLFSILFALSLSNSETVQSQSATKSDSVVLSAGYANEAYYSMAAGTVQTTPRATWDIAFRTMKMSSSILINDGSNVILYTYPKSDTSGWTTVDTTGLSTWKPMYNDPSDWENGAFSRNATGHPDYGWGVYNMSTHNITGDSVFVIKLRDGSYNKLWIKEKKSAANIYTFRTAQLDGSNDQTVVLDLNSYTGQEFYGYSLQSLQGVSFQPEKSEWDILFTKYMSVQSNGTPYLVTGVLTNNPASTKKFHPVPLSYSDFGAGVWDSTRSAIGWDWKVFDMGSFTFKIVDSTVYFIKQAGGDIYKLYFTAFTGSSSGIVRFNFERSAGAGILDLSVDRERLSVYPNPVKNTLFIILPDRSTDDLLITLTDLSGRQLRADRPGIKGTKTGVHSFDVTGVQPGNYLVTVLDAAKVYVAKVSIIN